MSTDLSASYLSDAARLQVVASYLRHEAEKEEGRLFGTAPEEVSCRTSPGHADVLARLLDLFREGRSVEYILESLVLEERWVLFHAVSYGCLQKELANSVGWPGLSWRLETLPLRATVFETPVGPLRSMGVKEPSFLDAVTFLQGTDSADEDEHALRDPLIGRVRDPDVIIHDGNGRLLSYAYAVREGRLSDATLVDVWVGRRRPIQPAEQWLHDWAGQTCFIKREC